MGFGCFDKSLNISAKIDLAVFVFFPTGFFLSLMFFFSFLTNSFLPRSLLLCRCILIPRKKYIFNYLSMLVYQQYYFHLLFSFFSLLYIFILQKRFRFFRNKNVFLFLSFYLRRWYLSCATVTDEIEYFFFFCT